MNESVQDRLLASSVDSDLVRSEQLGWKPQCRLARLMRHSWRRWRSRPKRELRLCETLALGERRFLVVVEFGVEKFLIGTSSSTMVLLSKLKSQSAEGEEKRSEELSEGAS